MEVCIMTPKNPPKFGKKEVIVERKLPYWIPEYSAHTKPQQISVKRKITFTVLAKNLREAEAKLIRFLSQIGLEIVHSPEEVKT